MIFTSSMRLLTAVAPESDSGAIATELLRLGVLETVRIRELAGDWAGKLSSVEPSAALPGIVELRKRVEAFMAMATPPVRHPDLKADDASALQAAAPDSAALGKTIDAMAAEVNGFRERQKDLQDEILKLDEVRRQVEAFGDLNLGAAASSSYTFLSIRTGLLPPDSVTDVESALAGLPLVVLPTPGTGGTRQERVPVVIVSLKRDAGRVTQALERLGWEDIRLGDESVPGKDEALSSLSARLATLRERQTTCSADLAAYLDGRREALASMWTSLRSAELVGRVQSSFSKTARTVLFSGWIPSVNAAAVEEGIRRVARGGCVIEWSEPGHGEAARVKAPVEMKNPAFLKPFEGLVRNYAIPEYGAVDPTPFVAVAYLIMFGLMFGDAGHGVVVALAGLAGLSVAKKHGKPEGLFRLVIYCGAAAMVTGVLFGSYFGMPLLPPVWFDYHGVVSGHVEGGTVSSVYDILGITIRFGMAVLGLGFALNWVNLVRKRDWFNLVLDKAGLAGGWIYAAGAWVAFYYVGHDYRELPPGGLLALLLGIPTLALALKAPLQWALGLEHGAHGDSRGHGGSREPDGGREPGSNLEPGTPAGPAAVAAPAGAGAAVPGGGDAPEGGSGAASAVPPATAAPGTELSAMADAVVAARGTADPRRAVPARLSPHGFGHGQSGARRRPFRPSMIMDFFMDWIVEVLEVYSGYLANTLSFMRVAGLGIAHVSLMTAFFQIARMITPEGPYSVAAIAVLVAGNALVIALEGLSAGIQSLRLNYYEFFSKYFNGSGRAYRPVSFNSRD